MPLRKYNLDQNQDVCFSVSYNISTFWNITDNLAVV
jgi:hypothetical protein